MQKMNSYIKDFTKLNVWQKSIDLIPDVNAVISKFPKYEDYALKSQLLRACYSVSGNLSEGNSQLYPQKEVNFINNAIGSASECRNWLIVAKVNSYITEKEQLDLDSKFEEVIKMLYACIKRLRQLE